VIFPIWTASFLFIIPWLWFWTTHQDGNSFRWRYPVVLYGCDAYSIQKWNDHQIHDWLLLNAKMIN
jgi:hypothetical protein